MITVIAKEKNRRSSFGVSIRNSSCHIYFFPDVRRLVSSSQRLLSDSAELILQRINHWKTERLWFVRWTMDDFEWRDGISGMKRFGPWASYFKSEKFSFYFGSVITKLLLISYALRFFSFPFTSPEIFFYKVFCWKLWMIVFAISFFQMTFWLLSVWCAFWVVIFYVRDGWGKFRSMGSSSRDGAPFERFGCLEYLTRERSIGSKRRLGFENSFYRNIYANFRPRDRYLLPQHGHARGVFNLEFSADGWVFSYFL
jgi:hypothetical protein